MQLSDNPLPRRQPPCVKLVQCSVLKNKNRSEMKSLVFGILQENEKVKRKSFNCFRQMNFVKCLWMPQLQESERLSVINSGSSKENQRKCKQQINQNLNLQMLTVSRKIFFPAEQADLCIIWVCPEQRNLSSSFYWTSKKLEFESKTLSSKSEYLNNHVQTEHD